MDPATIAMLLPAAINAGKGLFDMFKSKPKSPGNAAQPWLEKAAGLYQPYQQQGQEAYGKMNPIFSQMAQDPAAYLESMMKGYEPSQNYQNKFNAMSQAAGNTAAAGGQRGSLQDIQNQAGLSQSLMGDDMQQWLQNAMGAQGMGLTGLQDFYNKGYGATENLGNIYGNQGTLAMLNQMFQNQQSQGGMNDMWKNLSNLGGNLGGIDWSKLFNKTPSMNQGQGLNLGVNYGNSPKLESWMFPGMGG